MEKAIRALVEKANKEKRECPYCKGSGTRVFEVGPASDKTWGGPCPHGINHKAMEEILGIESGTPEFKANMAKAVAMLD